MAHTRNSDITVSLDQVVAIRSAEIERTLLDRRTALQKRDREISNRLEVLAGEYNAKASELCSTHMENRVTTLMQALRPLFPEKEITIKFCMNTDLEQSDEAYGQSRDEMFQVNINVMAFQIVSPGFNQRPTVLADMHTEYVKLIEEQQAGYAEMTEVRRGLAELPSAERQVRAAVARHVLSQSPDKDAIMALLEGVELPQSFTALLGHG
jgi:hypothetical protein